VIAGQSLCNIARHRSPMISRPAEDRAIVDAGLKALAFDLRSSCAGLTRVSTSLFRPPQGVGAHGSSPWAEGPRVKPGQDEIRVAIFLPWPQEFPHPSLRRDPRVDPAEEGREGALVCLRPRQPRRAALADHRPRRGVLRLGQVRPDCRRAHSGFDPSGHSICRNGSAAMGAAGKGKCTAACPNFVAPAPLE
jgi:hypothetical protein